jgi:hypothetical protein
MMTKKKPVGTMQRTVEREAELTQLEEQVVRMRKGLRTPAGLVLETKAGGNAELAARLEAIERRVLAAAAARPSPTKRKIVSALRQKRR